MDFPIRAVGNQDLARFGRPFFRPKHDDPHRMVKGRDADVLGEIPLGDVSHSDLAAAGRTEVGRNPVADAALLSVDTDLAVSLQITHIRPLGAMNAVDAAHRLVLGDEQASQVLGEVLTRWLVREQIAKLHDQFFNDVGNGNDRWHRSLRVTDG
jgi:hypothetical protein